VKRETWMLELPEAKAKSFGLGPRTFTRKGITQLGDRLHIFLINRKKNKIYFQDHFLGSLRILWVN